MTSPWRTLSDLLRDFRYALRTMRSNPGFTAAAVLTFALGLGATLAIYTVVDGVLLRPLPYPEPDRLVRVWHLNTRNDVAKETVAYETYRELAAGVPALDGAAGISPHWSFTVRTPNELERLQGYWVSASFFELLGARPVLGRGFDLDEDRPGGAPVAVISHAFWQRAFGGDPDIVGRTVPIGGDAVTMIGVLPRDFLFGEPADLWMPLGQNPLVERGRQVRWVDVVARLSPGADVGGSRDQIGQFMQRLEEAYPEANAGLRATVESLHTATVGDVRMALLALLGGVTFVLLIACANVGNLFLTRASARRGEMAVRGALGASRLRLLRHLVTEGLVLSLSGALLGTTLAIVLVDLFQLIGPSDLPRLQEIAPDLRLFGFAAVVAVTAGVGFGLISALAAGSAGTEGALKQGGRGTSGPGRGFRSILVGAQVAVALVLLTGAGLLLRSFVELAQVDPGFRADGVLTLQLALPEGTEADRAAAFYDELFTELAAIPSVEAVGGVTRLPLGGQVSTRLEIQGRTFAEADQPEVQFRRAGGDYFGAMDIPVLRGRSFEARDRADAPPVMMVSQGAAQALWPGEDPIGQQVRFWSPTTPAEEPWIEIVGITDDVREVGLTAEAPPVVYVPFSQGAPGSPLLAVRVAGDPASVARPVRDRIRALDPTIVTWDVRPMSDRVAETVAGRRFSLVLIGAFGALALALAAVGIYGVVAYAVRRRRRELGVRMALGATAAQIVRLVSREGATPVLIGAALGFVAAAGAARLLRALLFAVDPLDAWSFFGSVLLLLLVAASATWIPARRAALSTPMSVLREE